MTDHAVDVTPPSPEDWVQQVEQEEAKDQALEQRLEFNRAVTTEARRIRVHQEAARRVRLEALGDQPPVDAGTLAEILARPNLVQWRVDGLLPAGGRMLWSAQRKTGKTTALCNLARSLLTGEPFLGRFEVTKLDGRVVVLNYEVTGETFARWAFENGVPADRLYVINLRGRRNLLTDQDGRAELTALIRDQEGEVLMVDPFGRAYTGKSQNDAAEVAPWLVRLDEVAEQAGASELVLTAHAGWDGERTRGSSALEDWPDAIVTMTRDPDTDQRFIKAEGRDVDLPEDRLDYNGPSRLLTLSGVGSRRQVRATEHIEQLARTATRIVTDAPGINTTDLGGELRKAGEHLQRGDETAAVRLAEERGWILRQDGPRNSKQHYPRVPPESSPGEVVSTPDPSPKGGTTHTTHHQPSTPAPELDLLAAELGAQPIAEKEHA